MKLPKKIQPLFKEWLDKQGQYSTFVKWFILIFMNSIPFSLMYGMLTDFLDSQDINVFSQPGKFLEDTNKRCYYNSITGEKQNMQAWNKRSLARLTGISNGMDKLEKRIK